MFGFSSIPYLLGYGFIFFYLSLPISAQHHPFALGIGGGIDWIKNKDLAASPLTYEGFGLPVGINGFAINKKWIHEFEVRLILPLLTNDYPLKSAVGGKLKNWYKLNIHYQLQRKLPNNSNSYAGLSIKSDLFARIYDFLDGHGWEFNNSLGLNYSYYFGLPKGNFILPKVEIPIVGFLHRKPEITLSEEFIDDFYFRPTIELLKYGRWKGISKSWNAFNIDILYHLKINEKMSFQSKLGFNYYKIQFPEKVTHLNTPIRCYLNYHF